MFTVDSFLQDLDKNNFFQDKISWKHKERRILSSLVDQEKRGVFFTESQGNLLLKILKEYKNSLEQCYQSTLDFIENPIWSKNFRVLEIIKTIYIEDLKKCEILVKFTYNKNIKEHLFSLSKEIEGDIRSTNSDTFSVPLTENNIFLLVNEFEKHGFNFDKNIINFHKEIENIKKQANNNFDIFVNENLHLKNKLKLDIGDVSEKNSLLLKDRRLKFQYNYDVELENSCLTSKIANRTKSNIWIDSACFNLEEILKSLSELKRFPVLIIFDMYNVSSSKMMLDNINNFLKISNSNKKVGIYFRLDNTNNKDFNEKISELNFNSYLDQDVGIVGLSIKQLPKFIIKSAWKPSSIIYVTSAFKGSKIYTYCNSVDLIICHSADKPLHGVDYAIV